MGTNLETFENSNGYSVGTQVTGTVAVLLSRERGCGQGEGGSGCVEM